MNDKNSVIVIVGPTASGKSELAVKVAKAVGGEIISVDSRQIYRGMDIGTGKVSGSWIIGKFIYKGIPHYLIDEANPRRQFSVAQFKNRAQVVIEDILQRGKQPIICGGTAHWVDAIVFDQNIPEVKPNPQLRKKLQKLTVAQMYAKLQKLDPQRAKTIDPSNPRRLIRALEIVMATGKPVPKTTLKQKYNLLWLGIKPDQEKLERKIAKRLKERLAQGMIKEVKKLKENGLSWKRLESFGLEYKFCALYLQNKISKDELGSLLFTAIRQYAKKQMTWWKRNQAIHWSSNSRELLLLSKSKRQL
jgi:tRNA dimethylallyltransferase